MSERRAPDSRRPDRQGQERPDSRRRPGDAPPLRQRLHGVPLLSGTAFVLGMAVLAGWAAWPIYQAPYFFITAAGAVAVGIVIAAVSLLGGWSWLTTLLVTLLAYLVLGVPLAVPSALGGGADYLQGLLDLLARSVLGWKELVTIALPVGSYQALLVPLFAVLLAGVVSALSLLWRAARLDLLAVPILFAMVLFGIVFGSSLMSPAVTLFGYTLPAPRETAIGAAAFLVALAFLANRSRRARSAAQRRGAASGVAVRSIAGSARRASRTALSGTVLLLAVAVAVPVAAVPLRVDQRDVLRTAVEPELQLRQFVSPLSGYREFLGDGRYNTELLRVASTGEAPQRLRLAVMSYYDGQVFRQVDPARGVAERSTAFARMPGGFADSDAAVRLDVTIADYSEVWMPLAGGLSSVTFAGGRRQALTDGFFFNEQTDAGVQLNGLEPGDSYRLRAAAAQPTTLAELEKPAARATHIDDSVIPDSLGTWVAAQNLGSSDGAALQELIVRLRARGYLSHSLTAGGPTGHAWQQERGIGFVPSLAGHSVGRIDMLFSALLDKQASVGHSDDDGLVAAVGDDEQFAVAAALLAESLGFPARVVLGFRLEPGTTPVAAPAGMPACEAGVCSGRNLSAWVEVQGADGAWAAVDATPQSENPLAPSDEQKRDPQKTTEVIASDATEVTPPEAEPAGGTDTPDEQSDEGPDLAWLFRLLTVAGSVLLGLLILATPLIVMTLVKAARRGRRKRAADATERIAGGWEDYVDTAMDFGLPAPGSRTRLELAERYDTPHGRVIAVMADEAVFGPVNPSRADSDAYWASVDAERALLASEFTWWQRLAARLSARSFTRHLPAKGRRNG